MHMTAKTVFRPRKGRPYAHPVKPASPGGYGIRFVCRRELNCRVTVSRVTATLYSDGITLSVCLVKSILRTT